MKVTGRARLYACIAAANHGVTIAQIMGEGRQRPIVRARWEMWERLYRDGLSAASIGRMTNRDHTVVLHGIRQRAAMG